MSSSTDRLASSRIHRAGPAHDLEPATRRFDSRGRALALMTIALVGLAVLPDLVNYLNVEHPLSTVAVILPNSRSAAARIPLAHVVRWVASAVVFLVCSVIILMRGHPDRNISGAIILLLGLIFPYTINPTLPGKLDIAFIVMGAAVVLAVWNIGSSVVGLKWVPITASLIGAYSIIGGLIAPKYMMFDYGVSKKSPLGNWLLADKKPVIGDWLLAGPFAHGNYLGAYCALALALIPLIVSVGWRILHGLILCTTIVASASRTALVVAGVLALWWIICWFRSVISVRRAGTAMICLCAAIVLVLPLVSWNPKDFSGRAQLWATSLAAWQESRLVGLGRGWFTGAIFRPASGADWAYMESGHNLVIHTLVASGLLGSCVLGLVLLAAIRSTRAFDGVTHQIACFGYLIAFLVESATEVVWTLSPDEALFPVVGLVFAVIIVTRHDGHAGERGEVSAVT